MYGLIGARRGSALLLSAHFLPVHRCLIMCEYGSYSGTSDNGPDIYLIADNTGCTDHYPIEIVYYLIPNSGQPPNSELAQ